MMIRIPLSSLLPADYSTVDSAITWANSLPQDRYKDFSAVDAAIAAVQRDKVASEQDDVNAMAQAIMNAIHALESVGADYGVVNDLAAYAMSLNSAHYSNYNVVVEAFSAIDWDKSIEEQAAVNAMAQQLFAAINALIPLPADYAAVDAALAIIAGLPDPSYYVTFEGIRTAVSTVVRGKPKSQQSDVDAMAQTLIAAINSLQLYPADYRRVDQTILRAAELDASDYTNFDTVMTAARSVDRSKSILEQEEVDTMATTLMTAIDNLELVGADYTGVDTAIRYAQGLDPRDYTNFAALSEAIRAVDRSKTINEQAQVDQMAADIVQAILTLQRVAVTPTPSTTDPTPTPYTGTPGTSNGITLDQLKSLLNQNNTTSTTKTLSMPKTGAPYDATAIVVLVGCVCSLIVSGCVLYIFYGKKHTFKNAKGEK
ncbi:hypothetical protein SDC9_114185 [bioreactor metagenome]|uniref:Uncharacterized protein n=1 Tax=bioreactor metagenome TaxID=1076179 RepID=A0A645BVT8_9ZZZZ